MSHLTISHSSDDMSDFFNLFRQSKMLTKMNSAVLHTIRASTVTENLPSIWITIATDYTISDTFN